MGYRSKKISQITGRLPIRFMGSYYVNEKLRYIPKFSLQKCSKNVEQ